MDNLLATSSNILLAKRIFFPASFALVAFVGIILDGAGQIFGGRGRAGIIKN